VQEIRQTIDVFSGGQFGIVLEACPAITDGAGEGDELVFGERGAVKPVRRTRRTSADGLKAGSPARRKLKRAAARSRLLTEVVGESI
jgi:hypothetical protein